MYYICNCLIHKKEMSEIETLLVSIQSNSQRLVVEKANLLYENQQLKSTISELEQLIEQQTNQINLLKELNEKSKIEATLEEGDRNISAKTKIDVLVLEIDKCITLLNR